MKFTEEKSEKAFTKLLWNENFPYLLKDLCIKNDFKYPEDKLIEFAKAVSI